LAKLLSKLVNIYALKENYAEIVDFLQKLSVMDMETVLLSEDTAKSPDGFQKLELDGKTDSYARKKDLAENALKILDERFPEKKGLLASFSGPRSVDEDEFFLDEKTEEEILSVCEKISEMDRAIAEAGAEIVRLETSADQMRPWENLDVPLSFTGTGKTVAFIGTVSGSYSLEQILNLAAEKQPDLEMYVEIVNSDKDNTYIFATCLKEDSEKANAFLRSLSFARPSQITSKIPKEKIETKLKRIAECKKKIEECTEIIRFASEKRQLIEILSDFCRAKEENSAVCEMVDSTENTVLIKGYVAEVDIPYLEKKLSKKFDVVMEIEEVDPDSCPVKLKNNAFLSPAETITTMYSLPSAKDIDPTPLTGFFYYLLFGMMLSDAGYGLLMVIGTVLGLKLLKPSPQMRKTLKLFLYCGLSTVMWGTMFGSFFGDSIAVISKTFFGKEVSLPALIDPMNGGAVPLLIISIGIGLAQIIAGLCAKFITCIKNGDKAGAYFDAGLWITTLLGIAILAVGFVLYKPLTTVGGVVAIASLVGLVLTQGRDKKNPVMRIFSGLGSLYDITGYVSDLLSFSRLMALGLTTAAMGSVFNLLATLGGNGVVGVIMALIIFPVGHALCFALNALGAYVHTLRLQYVELFSKFYDGGGKEFKTFSFKNKYVGINTDTKEEN